MAKSFAPRIAKSQRKTLDLSDRLGADLFRSTDKKLLEGARLAEIALADIVVKEQVRTKFNDSSIKELAKNIEINGLIQPLVVHRTGAKFTLICGERRFRAMSSIQMKQCPCFIIENKTEEELMAIQFSENSSREELHYIDKADGILNYQKATGASERKIQAALSISKSEVHRSLLIAKLPPKVKMAAKNFNTEKYVLLEFFALSSSPFKKKLEKEIIEGNIIKRAELKKFIKNGDALSPQRKSANAPASSNISASAFIKAMNAKAKDLKLDKKTREMLKNLVEDTKEIVD